ncbi:MAG: sugar ABC transporter substrate-binding protein [Treponema sp.]|nr:sugar ABC transporter substrate-binding protein [Treponema sp.]
MQKKISITAVLFVMCILFAGFILSCSRSEKKGDSSPREIVFMTHIAAGENSALYKKTQQFMQEHPGVKVTINTVNVNDILNNFTTAAMAGSGPDIAGLDSAGWPIDAAAMNTLYPLTKWIEPIKQEYLQGPINAGYYENEYYTLPWYYNNAALYYNKGLLAKIGAAVPTNWAELESAVQKLTAAGYKGISTRLDGYAIFIFFFQAGNPVIDTSGPEPVVTVNNASGKKAWEYYTAFHTKYKAFPEALKEATDWDRAYTPFISGDTGFFIVGDWGYNSFVKNAPNLDFGIAPMPAGDKPATILGGYVLSMNKNTKHPDLAWEYMRFITSKEQDDTLLELGRAPARVNADTQSLQKINPFYNVFVEQSGVTTARPAVVNLKEVDQILVDSFKYVLFNQKTPQQALDDMEKQLKEFVERNKN